MDADALPVYGTSVHSNRDVDFTSDYEPSSASSGFTSIETATKYHIYEHGRYIFLLPPYPLSSFQQTLSTPKKFSTRSPFLFLEPPLTCTQPLPVFHRRPLPAPQ